MLGSFREKILSWGAKVLFGLLIISFGLWGIGDYNISGSNANDAIAEVGAASVKDMGKVMGILRPKLAGRADMSTVGESIKSMLK